jgi:hypothetical protein
VREKIYVRHFNVILLLNSITEMRGGVVVVGEGLHERPADACVRMQYMSQVKC